MAAAPDSQKGSQHHPGWEAVIGLEVHVHLSTKTKMFCRCENRFGAPPNSLTCPVCLGHPGTLPVINKTAVEYTVLAGLAFGSEIAATTKFDRKNYYYPDLPKNYQISQYDLPICSGGQVEVRSEGERRSIGLVRIHLEEDAGKNIHAEGLPESWVDLNRAGVPLLEIVSCPDIRTSEEAVAFLKTLRLTMLYLGISDCNMEEGSLRCDCNISVRPRGSDVLKTRAELKNINSFSFVMGALDYEIARQIQTWESGEEVVQETRLYDPARDETRSMRGKEEAHDYRYLPEPDLTPLRIDERWLDDAKSRIPRLPWETLDRFVETHGLPPYDSEILAQDPQVVEYVERCVELYPGPKKISNWVINDLFQEMNDRKAGIWDVGIPPERLIELIEAVDKKLVSVSNAREVFKKLLGNRRSVKEVVEEMGVGMISDEALIRKAVEEAISKNPAVLDDFRKGKKNAKNFLVGQVMRATKGKANPGRVSELIQEILGGRE